MSGELVGKSAIFNEKEYTQQRLDSLVPTLSDVRFGIEWEVHLVDKKCDLLGAGYRGRLPLSLSEHFNAQAANDNRGNRRPGTIHVYQQMKDLLGWQLKKEQRSGEDGVITAILPHEGSIIGATIEVGGNPEIVSNPYDNIHDLVKELQQVNTSLMMVAEQHDLVLLNTGFHDLQDAEIEAGEIARYRYQMMNEHWNEAARKVGVNGAAWQVTVGLTSQEHQGQPLYKKQVETLAILAIFLQAAMANSPFDQGRPAIDGSLSQRAGNWEKGFANNMVGALLWVRGGNFSFEKQQQLALTTNMVIKTNHEGFVSAIGHKAQDYMENGQYYQADNPFSFNDMDMLIKSTRSDVRPAGFTAEIRTLDSVDFRLGIGATAIVGAIIKNIAAMDAVLDMVAHLDDAQIIRLRSDIVTQGMQAEDLSGIKVQDYLQKIVEIAQYTLSERGLGEEAYLVDFASRVEKGLNPAQEKLALYAEKGSVLAVMQEYVMTPQSLAFDDVAQNKGYVNQLFSNYQQKQAALLPTVNKRRYSF